MFFYHGTNQKMETRLCRTAGVEVLYRIVEDAGVGSETIVCSGGLGGTHLIWSAVTRSLRNRYRLVIWDYPGLRAGETLPDHVEVDVPSLAGYLEAVLNATGTDRAVLVGWSLGVQVAMEFARLRADRLRGLITVCGLAGQPFIDESSGDPLHAALSIQKSMPEALEWLSERLERIDALRGMLRGIEHPTRWAKRFDLVDPHIDELVFDAVIRDFLALDPSLYNRYSQASAEHDAADILETLPFPVLAVAGERDRFIRSVRVQEMVASIPRCEYFEVRGATHYLPLEYGDLLALKIDEFIKKKIVP
ncbi:MAG: alpha/beta hydrolase [Deltaproteobacteria bacterium]|nr:alpha/beta hydrolase [Deltaproteobacteria bacterium]